MNYFGILLLLKLSLIIVCDASVEKNPWQLKLEEMKKEMKTIAESKDKSISSYEKFNSMGRYVFFSSIFDPLSISIANKNCEKYVNEKLNNAGDDITEWKSIFKTLFEIKLALDSKISIGDDCKVQLEEEKRKKIDIFINFMDESLEIMTKITRTIFIAEKLKNFFGAFKDKSIFYKHDENLYEYEISKIKDGIGEIFNEEKLKEALKILGELKDDSDPELLKTEISKSIENLKKIEEGLEQYVTMMNEMEEGRPQQILLQLEQEIMKYVHKVSDHDDLEYKLSGGIKMKEELINNLIEQQKFVASNHSFDETQAKQLKKKTKSILNQIEDSILLDSNESDFHNDKIINELKAKLNALSPNKNDQLQIIQNALDDQNDESHHSEALLQIYSILLDNEKKRKENPLLLIWGALRDLKTKNSNSAIGKLVAAHRKIKESHSNTLFEMRISGPLNGILSSISQVEGDEGKKRNLPLEYYDWMEEFGVFGGMNGIDAGSLQFKNILKLTGGIKEKSQRETIWKAILESKDLLGFSRAEDYSHLVDSRRRIELLDKMVPSPPISQFNFKDSVMKVSKDHSVTVQDVMIPGVFSDIPSSEYLRSIPVGERIKVKAAAPLKSAAISMGSSLSKSSSVSEGKGPTMAVIAPQMTSQSNGNKGQERMVKGESQRGQPGMMASHYHHHDHDREDEEDSSPMELDTFHPSIHSKEFISAESYKPGRMGGGKQEILKDSLKSPHLHI